MEKKRKQTRAYTISDESFYYLKKEGEIQGRSASNVLDEILKKLNKNVKQNDTI
jgi:predicted CopG family antitoxin